MKKYPCFSYAAENVDGRPRTHGAAQEAVRRKSVGNACLRGWGAAVAGGLRMGSNNYIMS